MGVENAENAIIIVSFAYMPVWIWFVFTFFFPVGLRIIIRGLRGLFAIEYLTPHEALLIVRAGVAELRRDLIRFGGLLGVTKT